MLAVFSLWGDSLTFDETSHLSAGMSNLLSGDFRLGPDHPPLAKYWCAWPLLLSSQTWPSPTGHWLRRDPFGVGRDWYYTCGNDAERLVRAGRMMMVVLLLCTLLTIWAIARRMFGGRAALLSLALAALCPTMLAHGRLVTTDLPVTLCGLLSALTLARLMERVSAIRWLAAAGAMGALALVKFSWPVFGAAIAVIVLVRMIRPAASAELTRPQRTRATLTRLVAVAALIPAVWAIIWTCYLWRYSMFADETAATMPSAEAALPEDAPPISPRASMEAEWERLLNDAPPGSPMRRAAPMLRWARDRRLLPEAYLFGFTYALRGTQSRESYLMGEFSTTGFRAYFPLVFLIKTPVATLILLAAGLAAVVTRRARPADGALFTGLAVFFGAYAFNSIASGINIGHRHLLPLYPIIYVIAGAALAWLPRAPSTAMGATPDAKRRRGVRGLLVATGPLTALLTWLAGANLLAFPHYLSYFNELIGGPREAHRYVVDSNIDWGQDLNRLAAYARRHPAEKLKLAYFGSADPARYGFDVKSLVSYFPFEPRAPLTAGTYVVSLTQLVGVYDPEIRESFWRDPKMQELYRRLAEIAAAGPPPGESQEAAQRRERAMRDFAELRYRLLIARLRQRHPDERVGWSLWVYRLREEDVDQLTQPGFSEPRTGPSEPRPGLSEPRP
ncbi:hypothetical protein RAS1_38960 [Phycisphaerae bacterium RAS1]|nr:hypothetical protein RAS1_38960 [Phycisphaerae bacterium RAS1]